MLNHDFEIDKIEAVPIEKIESVIHTQWIILKGINGPFSGFWFIQ